MSATIPYTVRLYAKVCLGEWRVSAVTRDEAIEQAKSQAIDNGWAQDFEDIGKPVSRELIGTAEEIL